MKSVWGKTQKLFSLWNAFGLLFTVICVQGFIVIDRTGAIEKTSTQAVGVIEVVSQDIDAIRADADREVSVVNEVVQRVQTDLVSSMKSGSDDMWVLQKNVEKAISNSIKIVNLLEAMLDSGTLDEDTEGAIEEMLFQAEDAADAIRKEAMPIVRVSLQRIGRASEAAELTAVDVVKLKSRMETFAQSSERARENVDLAVSKIHDGAIQTSDARRWILWSLIGSAMVALAIPFIIVPRINRSVHGIIGATAQLLTTAKTLTKGANETKEMSVTAVSASEELSISLARIAESINQIRDNTNDIESASGELITKIEDASQSMRRSRAVAAKATGLLASGGQHIQDLGAAAQEIGEVSEVIQNIAELTNLLALNATIEAARAGEAGKGFAVVAGEVKGLSQQTSDATAGIRKRIEAIQSAAQQAIELVAQIGDAIDEVETEATATESCIQSQEVTTQSIVQRISQNAAAASEVASSMDQMTTSSREIAASSYQVESAAHGTADAAQTTRDSGEYLTTISLDLGDAVSFLKSNRKAKLTQEIHSLSS